MDGHDVKPNEALRYDDGCHTLELHVTGASGARAWALLEERP
jgi:hypothetical protein